MLTRDQVAAFWRHGFVVVKGGASAAQVAALNARLAEWVEDSRAHSANFGTTIDGRARFDLEASHSAERPRLRRVANPQELDDTYLEVVRNAPLVDMVADLIGPDVRFHHAKINVKLPHSETEAGWHQDHPFDPHTNDDVVVSLLMLSDMDETNGALRVVPGSHRGPRYSHRRDGRFVGAIDPEVVARLAPASVAVEGRAGDVCLMHTWMVHGSPANPSSRPRALLITDYTAADAVPLTPPSMPSRQFREIVRGRDTRSARLIAGTLELPDAYREDSFFVLQGQPPAAA